jgi:hypothetical protein
MLMDEKWLILLTGNGLQQCIEIPIKFNDNTPNATKCIRIRSTLSFLNLALILAFYATRRFITVFTRAIQWSLS